MDENLYYRADPDDARPIEVLVIPRGSAPVRGRVIDVFVDGIGVRMPRSLALPLGTEVELGLSVPGAERPVALSAVVGSRREGRSFRRYGLSFTSLREIEEKIPQGLYSIFNRRRAERYRLSEPLEVMVIPDGRYETLPATLRDVSLVGVAVTVEPKLEHVLAGAERLQLCIDPEGLVALGERSASGAPPQEPLMVSLIVHNRLLFGQIVRYGCEFNPMHSDSSDKASRLVALVLSREGRNLAEG